MDDGNRHVCPVERAGTLDNRLRRWLQDPRKILAPYITEGMTVLDIGCGPGFFSIDIAQMVGKSGRVIASDMQEGMLQRLSAKVQGTELEERILLHQCKSGCLGVTEAVDFALAFYMMHEVPDQERLFAEVRNTLKPNGQVLVVEPPFHVSKSAFEEMIGRAIGAGLTPVERPKVPLSKTVLLQRADSADHVDANRGTS